MIKYLFVTILAFSTQQIVCQNFTTNLNFKNKAVKKSTISFELINNCIVIPVRINKSDNLNFILDSGTSETIITELPEKEYNKLKFSDKTHIFGIGNGHEIEADKSYGNKIQIGSIIGDYQDITVAKPDKINYYKYFGTEINGIIGSDIFNNFIVIIDYSKNKITFYLPGKFEYKKKYEIYSSSSLEIVENKPLLNISTVQGLSSREPEKTLISTGSDFSIQFFENSIIKPDTNRVIIYDKLGIGLCGDIYGKKSRIDSLEFINHKLSQVTCIYPEKYQYSKYLENNKSSFSSVVGGRILKKFDLIIDYPNQKISVKPNKYFHQPFNFDMSGLEIESYFKDLPIYTIKNVNPESPAKEAGFKKGDQIISVNGQSTLNLSLSTIREMFISTEIQEYSIKILREDNILDITLKLKPNL